MGHAVLWRGGLLGLPVGLSHSVSPLPSPTTGDSPPPAQGTAPLPSHLCFGSGEGVPHFSSPQPHWDSPPAPPPGPCRTKGKGNKTKPTAQTERGLPGTRPRLPRGSEPLPVPSALPPPRGASPRTLQLRLRAGDARALADLLPLLLLLPPLLLLPQRLLEGVSTGEKLRGDGRGSISGSPPASQRHDLPQTHRTSPAMPEGWKLDGAPGERGPDAPTGQVATGGGRWHQAPENNRSPAGEFDARVLAKLPLCWGGLAAPHQATRSLSQPAAWSHNKDREAHGASRRHYHLTSEWSVLKGLR